MSKNKVLLLSDSTCKYVNNINWLDCNAISGANIYTLQQFVKDNKSLLRKYTHLLLHVGTNDVGNGLSSKLIIQYYNNLIDFICNVFPSLKIIVSAILPRPIHFDDTKQTVIDCNKALAKLSLKKNILFVKTYKQFVQQPGSIYKSKCFCKDRLHLSYFGVSVLRNFFIGEVHHL